jgi:hypothetical protein
MRYQELLIEGEPQTFYHGTLAANVPSILQQGLRPSGAATADGRWATLGGVYLTNTFAYAVKAAKMAAGVNTRAPIAVVTVQLTSTKGVTPDEDVIEKVLVKAFTTALDWFGIDADYEGDLDQYAYSEEVRPRDDDDNDEPFDRDKFFRDFWATVTQQMSELAGTPRRRDPNLVRQAAEIALELADEDISGGPPDSWSEQRWQEWQTAKTQLVGLYPRLRNAEQHAKAGVTIAHNVRVTKPIPLRQIVTIVQQDGKDWKTVYSR